MTSSKDPADLPPRPPELDETGVKVWGRFNSLLQYVLDHEDSVEAYPEHPEAVAKVLPVLTADLEEFWLFAMNNAGVPVDGRVREVIIETPPDAPAGRNGTVALSIWEDTNGMVWAGAVREPDFSDVREDAANVDMSDLESAEVQELLRRAEQKWIDMQAESLVEQEYGTDHRPVSLPELNALIARFGISLPESD